MNDPCSATASAPPAAQWWELDCGVAASLNTTDIVYSVLIYSRRNITRSQAKLTTYSRWEKDKLSANK